MGRDDSIKSSIERSIESIPVDLPGRDSICDLLRGIGLISVLDRPPLCRRLLEIDKRTKWPFEWLFDAGAQSVREGLQVLSKGPSMYASIRGHTQELPIIAAIGDDSATRTNGLEHFRAVLVCAAYFFERTDDSGIPETRLLELAEVVRGIERSPGSPYHAVLRSLPRDATKEEVAETVAAAMRAKALMTDFAASWIHDWVPFLTDSSRTTRVARPKQAALPSAAQRPEEKPSTAEVDKSEVDEVPRALISGVGLSIDPADEGDCAEGTDWSVTVPTLMDAEKENLQPQIATVLFATTIRGSNKLLSSHHITTCLPVELRQTVSVVLACFDHCLLTEDIHAAGCCIHLLLVILTGWTPEDCACIAFSRSGTGAWLDLKAGLLHRATLIPPHIHSAAPGTDHLYEDNADTVSNPLPPAFVSRARRLLRISHPSSMAQWAGPDPSIALGQFLRDRLKLPASITVHRLRNWLMPALFATHADLGAVMQIGGQSAGLSISPLYYSCPQIGALQAHYVRTVWPAFGDPIPPTQAFEAGRAGPALLPKREVVVRAIGRQQRQLNVDYSTTSSMSDARIIELHNRFVTHAANLFALTTLVRAKGIELLRRFDVVPDALTMVVQDKGVDAAHRFRAVAISPLLIEQYTSLLEHLSGLSKLLSSEAALGSIRNALAGNGALFFYLDLGGNPAPFSEGAWSESLSEFPKDLRLNWYRTFGAQLLFDHGVAPALVHSHLGHLQAAGFPFQSESSVSVVDSSQAMQRPLQLLAKALRLHPRRGLHGSLDELPATPVFNWKAELETQALVEKNAVRQFRSTFLLATRAGRVEADRVISEIATSIDPAIASALDEERHICSPIQQIVATPISDDQLNQMLSLIQARGQANAFKTSCILFRFSQLINRRRRQERIQCRPLTPMVVSPGSEPSPFLAGMGDAARCVTIWRQRFIDRAHSASPMVRAAATCLLFGYFESVEQLFEALKAAPSGRLTPAPFRTYLIHTSPLAEGGCAGSSGLAAVALSRLQATDVPHDFSIQWLRHQLSSFLRDDETQQVDGLLDRALHCCRVMARLELSGVDRIVASASHGAVFEQQLAHLSNFAQLASSDKDARVEAEKFRDVEATRKDRTWVSTAGDDTTSLLAAVLNPLRSLGLSPDTEEDRRVVLLPRIVAALDQLHFRPGAMPEALRQFARHLCTDGTPMRATPAPSTIYSYLTRIATPLTERCHGFLLADLDEADFSDLYQVIVEAHRNSAVRADVAAQLLHFHDFLVRRWNCCPLDPGELTDALVGEDHVHTELIPDAQYLLALSWLQSQFQTDDPNSAHTAQWRRRCHAAAVCLILFRRAGLRASEALRLPSADLVLWGDAALLMIRPSVFRRLKTAAARRLIDLKLYVPDAELQIIRAWDEMERTRIGGPVGRKTLAFPSLDMPFKCLGFGDLREIIQLSFTKTCGRHIWVHLLRHAFVNDQISRLMLLPDLADVDIWSASHRLKARDLVVAVGHTRLSTTVRCYFHLSSIACRGPALFTADIGCLSAASGLNATALYKFRVRHPQKDLLLYAAGRDPTREPDPDRALRFAVSAPKESALRHVDLFEIFRDAPAKPVLIQRSKSYCLSSQDANRLWSCAEQLASLTRYRIVPLPTRKGEVSAAPPPRLNADIDLRDVWSRLESDPQLAQPLIECFVRAFRPVDEKHDRFAADDETAARLLKLLLGLGFAAIRSRLSGATPDRESAIHFGSSDASQTSTFHLAARVLAIVFLRSRLMSPQT